MARELFLWIPALMVMAGLWLGCGQQVNSASPTPSAPSADAGDNTPVDQPEPEHTELIADPADKPAAGARSLASHLPKKTTMDVQALTSSFDCSLRCIFAKNSCNCENTFLLSFWRTP